LKANVRPFLNFSLTIFKFLWTIDDPNTPAMAVGEEMSKYLKCMNRSPRNGSTVERFFTRQRNTSSVGDMLQHLNWFSLEDRRKDGRLDMIYNKT